MGLQVEDTAEIVLRFDPREGASGAIASVHLDYLQQPATHTLEIIGTQGTLRWNNADGSLAIFRSGGQDWQVETPPDGFERNWLFMEEMRNFLAVARGEAQPACTLADGLRALEISLAARDSALDGQVKTLKGI